MQINIHWGEFKGPVYRTSDTANTIGETLCNNHDNYRYDVELRGYLPFALFKNKETDTWLPAAMAAKAVASKEVIFYTEKIIDAYEHTLQCGSNATGETIVNK